MPTLEPPPPPESESPLSPEPPKLPQFSDTEARLFSIFGGRTTCSQTRPRSSDIERRRLAQDSWRRVSSQSLREQTDVASSETCMRCVLPNSEKMLLGWSAEVGSLSFAG